MSKNDKTLVWIDRNFSRSSPIMQRFCSSIEHFKAKGYKVEVWCTAIEPSSVAQIDHVVMFRVGPYWLEGVLRPFLLLTSLRILWQKMHGRKDVIYHSTKACGFGSDVGSHNFSGIEWVMIFFKLKHTPLRDWIRLPITLGGVFLEWVEMTFFRPRLLIANSDGLRDMIIERYKQSPSDCFFIRNQINTAKFSAERRLQLREVKRGELGFKEADFIFVFVGQGHMARKGWFEAVLAVSELAARGKQVKLLCVGFNEAVIERAVGFLNASVPNWQLWLLFEKPTPEVDAFLSACDCFLFPSHFDSCANVAQEAYAMGLPCILGDYYGASLLTGGACVKIVSERSEELVDALDVAVRDWRSAAVEHVDVENFSLSPQQWAESVMDVYRHLEMRI